MCVWERREERERREMRDRYTARATRRSRRYGRRERGGFRSRQDRLLGCTCRHSMLYSVVQFLFCFIGQCLDLLDLLDFTSDFSSSTIAEVVTTESYWTTKMNALQRREVISFHGTRSRSEAVAPGAAKRIEERELKNTALGKSGRPTSPTKCYEAD